MFNQSKLLLTLCCCLSLFLFSFMIFLELTLFITSRCIRLAMVYAKLPEVIGIVGHAGQVLKIL